MIVMPVDDSEGLLVNKVRHSHNLGPLIAKVLRTPSRTTRRGVSNIAAFRPGIFSDPATPVPSPIP